MNGITVPIEGHYTGKIWGFRLNVTYLRYELLTPTEYHAYRTLGRLARFPWHPPTLMLLPQPRLAFLQARLRVWWEESRAKRRDEKVKRMENV